MLSAAIFDVDGVLLASPHERAWREALDGLVDPAAFTTVLYQTRVAGKARLDGALAALEALGVADAAARAAPYAARKQARLEALVAEGPVEAFPDALRLLRALKALGWSLAAASASKNASGMLRTIAFDGETLLAAFGVNACGRDVTRGKPDPELYALAACELGVAPARCLVIEDAPAGILAARAGGMASLGIARLSDEAVLVAAGADLVVTSLDAVSRPELAAGRLAREVS